MRVSLRLKTIFLKTLIHALALFSLTIVLSTRIGRLGRFLTTDSRTPEQIGDLYKITRLNYFLQLKPAVPIRNKTTLKDASILVFSDSFGAISVDDGSFHMRLEKSLGLPVLWQYHRITDNFLYANPLYWLEVEAPPNMKAKVLVFVTVERFFNVGLYNYRTLLDPPPAPPRTDSRGKSVKTQSRLNVADLIFDNSKIEYVFKNSFFTRWLFEATNSAKFIILGQTSNLVPKYSLSPKMLYYYQEIESFNESLESKKMGDMVLFFTMLKEELLRRYGITLVLVPVPNKYTIYHDRVDPATTYNNFLPILVQELEKKGIICVDLYPAYMERRADILYWSDDTHWNGNGIELAVRLTEKALLKNKLIDSTL